MEKLNINLKEIEIKDLDGFIIQVPDLPQKIGNMLFLNAETIELDGIARILHKGETAEVTKEEIKQVVETLNVSPRCYKVFAHLQIIQYFTDKLKTE